MRVLDYGGMPTSLGEIINIKFHLDSIRNKYDEIRLGFHTQLWDGCLYTNAPDWEYKKQLWNQYLADIGQLFFSDKPYVLMQHTPQYGGDIGVLVQKLRMNPMKASMAHLLCKGVSLNLGEEYIVITTKIRHLQKTMFFQRAPELMRTLNDITKRYKIVILGERFVEMRREYSNIQNEVFGIYEQLISNLPTERVLDLTVPALGETASSLKQIQQDCLIMNEAKFVLTLGVGGNFCMSTSVAKMAIGFRADSLRFTDRIFEGRTYPDAFITKDWNQFINKLKMYM